MEQATEFAVILKGRVADLKDVQTTLVEAGLTSQILRPDCDSVSS